MALADEIVKAAKDADMEASTDKTLELKGKRFVSGKIRDAGIRAAVAAALRTLAASEMPHTSGYRRADFEELAADVREGT